ncbi:hypothetical protein RclHR1_06940009 [Rhizophagus clarus]|uniref:Kinase-like domain-containing protein n=1 Tax=Rhizophagus clarus TaxID=94130 RepID=A0A2Z6SBH3_9GLOM|nr:hypothetical protein RclHR1_06940009 [Rhizophagus clarus]GES87550.1 kinase-like domain-containing protein [Rhizophagus clarus]
MSSIKENQLVSEFNELNISDKDSISVKINHEDCYDLVNKKFWYKECVSRSIIEGWTSGNYDIDSFIKVTIYNVNNHGHYDAYSGYPIFLEWVPFNRFEDTNK